MSRDRTTQLKALMAERILVMDGAYGTMIQRYRLDEADEASGFASGQLTFSGMVPLRQVFEKLSRVVRRLQRDDPSARIVVIDDMRGGVFSNLVDECFGDEPFGVILLRQGREVPLHPLGGRAGVEVRRRRPAGRRRRRPAASPDKTRRGPSRGRGSR